MGLLIENGPYRATAPREQAQAPAPAPQRAKKPWEPSSAFVPYDQYVRSLGANPDIVGLTVRDASFDRLTRPDGEGHYLRVYLGCTDSRKPPEDFENVLVQLTLLRFLRDDVSEDEYWKRMRELGVGSGYGAEDYEELDTAVRLTTMHVNQRYGMSYEEGVWRFQAAMNVTPDKARRIEDGIYLVGLDVGGAKLTADARIQAYPFP